MSNTEDDLAELHAAYKALPENLRDGYNGALKFFMSAVRKELAETLPFVFEDRTAPELRAAVAGLPRYAACWAPEPMARLIRAAQISVGEPADPQKARGEGPCDCGKEPKEDPRRRRLMTPMDVLHVSPVSARAGGTTPCPVASATSTSTMNMNYNPTVEQLAALLRACDDTAAHHILWVAKDGGVRVTPLPRGMFPADFGDRPDLRLRYETFQVGNGYTGAAAADDTSYVEELLGDLVRGWRDGSDYIGGLIAGALLAGRVRARPAAAVAGALLAADLVRELDGRGDRRRRAARCRPGATSSAGAAIAGVALLAADLVHWCTSSAGRTRSPALGRTQRAIAVAAELAGAGDRPR